MPCFKVFTNIPQREIPKDFVNKIIPILSKVLNKEEHAINAEDSDKWYQTMQDEYQSLFDKITWVLIARSDKKKFICTISGDCQLTFGGESESPGAVATLESVGHLGPKENKVIVKGIADFVQKELKIQPNRFFMTLYDINAYAVGINGSTIA